MIRGSHTHATGSPEASQLPLVARRAGSPPQASSLAAASSGGPAARHLSVHWQLSAAPPRAQAEKEARGQQVSSEGPPPP